MHGQPHIRSSISWVGCIEQINFAKALRMGSSKLSLAMKCCACAFLAGSPWWWTVLTTYKCVIMIYVHWILSNKLLAGQVLQNLANIHHLTMSRDRQVPTKQIDAALSIGAGCMWRKWNVRVHSVRHISLLPNFRGALRNMRTITKDGQPK